MSIFFSVQIYYDVDHLTVGEFWQLVVKEHTVGREREAEILVVHFFLCEIACNELLDHVEAYKSLTPPNGAD